ncbi:MAG TPA: site-2 protease family protein [bacterium]|jgi:Zn-dependent protease
MPDLTQIILIAPSVLLALAFHEFSHGWVANRLGDPTARLAGRLTMNPLSHLDILGTIMLFIPPHIGWAKPVPVNPYNLNQPKRDIVWVSLAGPGANLLMALGFGLVIRGLNAGLLGNMPLPDPAVMIIFYGLLINISLAVFNLIPIPPLDGSRVLGGLLPSHLEMEYRKLDRFGPFLILILVMVGSFLHIPILGFIITPFVRFFAGLFAGIPNLI